MLDSDNGLQVKRMSEEVFSNDYTPLPNYPPVKACEAYLSYGRYLKASKEALDVLGKLINVPHKGELLMPHSQEELRRMNQRAAATTAAAPAKVKPKPTAPAKAKSDKPRESASQLFKALIMEGKLTDDQIFTKVQLKYGLDAKKRGYVAWYRNYLKKQKKNPPDPVEPKK